MKKMFAALVATMLASPALAQSYSATYGTGNTVNLPLAEQSNGALGVGVGMYSPNGGASSPYAYAPASRTNQSRYQTHRARTHQAQ